MEKVWSRKEAEADAATLFDAARMTPQTIQENDGKLVVRFEPGAKIPVSEWAVLPGTLEDDDVL
ncbi:MULTISPECIES: hypothetical protein [Rhizobium]|jgi:hypothetical protein|uniref:Uncharacterized protein n=1 Tax=Rhizobium leguminosarum TaxID=384 RepID=A0A6P0DNS2_RHILE|nr:MULTISPECIES: hypothetical protein [Rhizobium]MDH6276615.1 hypothetical protein [Rhizobium leguminosarum]NEK53610.1 hypothetical protein [Rhizobium leguminosarum]NNH83549.1 hypothetical protein [Rhizobium laguerreae]TCA89207.1 hypothetical protein E0H76_31465 [Rhizobium leguminosarum bv. viciae]